MKTSLLTIVGSIIIFLFSPGNLQAQLSGEAIMVKVYELPTGDNTQGELIMTLTNKQGEERVRKLTQYLLNEGDTEKKIMFFTAPADVKGTSFMNWSYSSGKDDDQWIYLPALKRTKRISSSGKGDYFMGSDFTYDDLGDRHPTSDTHQLVREEGLNGVDCYVVESTPKDPDYMYSRTLTWVDKSRFIGLKRAFYDEDGDLLKILTIKSIDEINGILTILETEMEQVQKNHRTNMKFSNVKVNQGISANKFTERSMTLGQ